MNKTSHNLIKINHAKIQFISLIIACILLFPNTSNAGNKYWNGSGTWDITTANMWGTSSGTYNTVWASYDVAFFDKPSSITVGSTVVRIAGITATDNVTITAGAAFQCATAANAYFQAPINVSIGKLLDFGSQGLQTNASGLQMNGPGELAITGTAYTGGFTLNGGTVTCKGGIGTALGSGILTINGGAIAANINNTLTPSSIIIGGNFTLGAATSIATIGSNITFNNSVDLGAGTSRVITLGGSGVYIFKGIISGASSSLTIQDSGNNGFFQLEGANTYSGGTIINSGTLRINAANTIPAYGLTLGGGRLLSAISTSAIGFSDAMGKLTLTNNSTISFGTGNHTISFSDSHLTGWTPGKKITITGWIGSPGASGTAGKIFVGNDATGLTAGQLAQISFTGYTGAQILPTGEIVPTAFTSPTLSSAINPTVDASFNISFTDNPTWRSAITSITVGGTILSASAYNTTVAGQITLTPSASTLLQTPGTKTIVVSATGYADATVSQTIGAGVPTSANSTATIDSPLARNSSSTITCTAKDQYNNLVQGYTFKYNAVITNADVTTSESYTIDGASVSSTATNSLSTTTSSSGVTTFTVGLPAAIDGGDGVSIQVKLGDGSTNIGSAFSYTEQTYNLNGTKYTADLSLNSFSDVTVSTGELTINTDASVKSITVAKGAKLTYSSGTLSTTNGIKLQNTDTGTASFVDTRTSDSPSPIAGTVEQAITETNRNWYVAIPVSGKYASDITLTGAKIVQRNEAQSRWDDVTGSLIPGVGYIAVASTNSGTTTWSLNGNLNSGKVQVDITNSGASYTGFNLLGNPYPSYLNWEQVLNLNTTNASLLQSSIWYRTAAYNSGTSKFDYTFNTYNSTGRISTPASTSGYIPPMQAFWVRANSAGTVTFTNAMRSHGDGASNKLKAPSANKVNQQILRLQISNGTNMDETVIYTNPNASNIFDNFDSPKMSNNSASIPEIFTVAGSEQLVINGMNCITPNQEISLGFTTGQSNAFSIKATEVSNFDAGTQVVLLDNQTNTQWNLTDGSAYNFSSDITSSNTSRFSIIFKSASVTTGNINNSDSNSIQIYRNDNNLIAVNFGNEIIGQASASVYNAVGQKLTEQNLQHSTTVFSKSFTAGLYLVSVTVNGKTTTQKVVIK